MLVQHEKLIPKGHPNRPGGKLDKLLALVFHYTANDNLGATDTANAAYFARGYVKNANGIFELGGTKKFGYGSTNKIVDKDSVTVSVPVGEPTYNAGDRQYPYENGFKGQTRLAKEVFGYRQNYTTISWEMCNNDDWPRVVMNTVDDAIEELIKLGIKPWNILLLRHHDLSGKICPKAFVDSPEAWEAFKADIYIGYAKKTGSTIPIIHSNVLKRGSCNDLVAEVMDRLSFLGYKLSGNIFWDVEQAIVTRFQKEHNLEVDGVAGPGTQKRINYLIGRPNQVSFTVMKKGTNDGGVATLMCDLFSLGYGPNKNFFGLYEEILVRKFQEDNNLEVDGIAGPATQAKIFAAKVSAPPVTPAPKPTPAPATPEPKFLFQAKSKVLLNFRSTMATTQSNIIGKIPKGGVVKVLKVDKLWASIEYGGQKGFVMYSYLTPTAPIFHPNYSNFRMFSSDVHVFEVTPDMFLDLEDGIKGKFEATSSIVSDSKLTFLGKELARMNAQFFGGGSDGLGSIVDEGNVIQGPNPVFIDVLYYKNGSMDIKSLKAADLPNLAKETHWITGSSWQVVYNGKEDLKNYEAISHYNSDNPRSVLIWFGKDHFALMAIDGRGTVSKLAAGARNNGVTARESGKIALSYKSKLNGATAIHVANYDGGGSTTLKVMCLDGIMRIANTLSEGAERAIGTIFIAFERKK